MRKTKISLAFTISVFLFLGFACSSPQSKSNPQKDSKASPAANQLVELRGRLFDAATSKPISSAQVYVGGAWQVPSFYDPPSHTTADGTFAFSELPESGEYVLNIPVIVIFHLS